MRQFDHLRWDELWGRSRLDVDVNRHTVCGAHPAHDHDFLEIFVVVAGRGTHETEHGRRRVAAGDAYVLRPGAWHAYADCEGLRLINCCIRRRLLERELLWLAEEQRLRLLLWPLGADAGAVHLRLPDLGLEACTAALRQLAAPPPEEPRAHQLAHLLLFLRCLALHFEPPGRREAERSAAVVDALRMLAGDLGRPWSVADLAAAVAVSPAHLSRLFRRSVGCSPMAHLSRLRAEAAAALLLSSEEPVAAIGATVGWADPSHFARRFRSELGLSPTAFRQAAGGRSS